MACGWLFLALRKLEAFCGVSGICNSFHKRTLCTVTLVPPALSQGWDSGHCKDVGQSGRGLAGIPGLEWVRAHGTGQADNRGGFTAVCWRGRGLEHSGHSCSCPE